MIKKPSCTCVLASAAVRQVSMQRAAGKLIGKSTPRGDGVRKRDAGITGDETGLSS